MTIPSIMRWGPRLMMSRSLKVPGSPASALITRTRGRERSLGRNPHLTPAGNPAPPRPRRFAFLTSATISSFGIENALRMAAYPPSCSYVSAWRYRSLPKWVARTRSIVSRRLAGGCGHLAVPVVVKWIISFTSSEPVEDRIDRFLGQVLVVIVVDLRDRRGAAGSAALDRGRGEVSL